MANSAKAGSGFGSFWRYWTGHKAEAAQPSRGVRCLTLYMQTMVERAKEKQARGEPLTEAEIALLEAAAR